MTSQTIAPQQPHVADSHAAIMGQLIDFINHNLLVEDDIDAVDADTPMLELGVLDSLAMVSLLTFVESDLGVRLPDDAVVPEHFETPRALAGLIAAHQEAQPAPGAKREGHHILADTVAILEAAGIERNTVALASGERMHILQVDGATPTWVMLPGLGNPSSSWGMMLRSLADEQAAVAVDLAGFGLSTCPQERPTYADHLRALMTLLETAVTPPYVLVGSSAGALLAAEIARQYPERTAALVMTGFGLIADAQTWWRDLMALSATPEAFLEAAFYRPPKQTDTFQQAVAEVLSRPAYTSFLDGGGFEAMGAAFDHIQAPTLLVAGEHDRIMPPSTVEAAAERMPSAQLEWLARCGHFPPTEQPEELLYVIRNFLKKQQM